MALSPGSRVGIYEVVAPIGRGGMGEVYRARDPKLQRDVAIKALPEEFQHDRERLARFEREARLLASLNHTNIAAIYGLEEQGGARFLIMELVEGQTLAERLAAGPLPLEEALAVGAQIALGLEAAHEAGIIHRDLKPSNVKLRPGGSVKVLDLGLARTVEAAAASDSSLSPTMTTPATRTGTILGTAAYMSPEQARGKPLDRRTDIFSFGCVLYESLTGTQTFSGETVSDTLSAILRAEPDWSALPPGTPFQVREVLRRSLQKDPKRRLQNIADARIEIEEALAGGSSGAGALEQPAASAPPARGRFAWALGGALVGAMLAAIASMLLRSKLPAAARVHAVLPLADTDTLFTGRPPLAFSPDGQTVVFSAIRDGSPQLFRRSLAADRAEPISGTALGSRPFFSPDGQWIGFIARNELRKVPVLGGTAVPLSNIPPVTAGASWGADGRIVLPMGVNTGLFSISETGGALTPLARIDDALGEHALLYPQILPDGHGILCTQRLGRDFADLESSNIVVLDAAGKRHTVLEGATFARYGGGRLVFLRGLSAFTVAFDLSRLVVVGAPVPLAEEIAVEPTEGIGYFALSAGGTLAFVDGPAIRPALTTVIRVDRQGNETSLSLPAASYFNPRLSPDGKRLALVRFGGLRSAIVVYDRERNIVSTLTPELGRFFCPLWSPDGTRIAFSRMLTARPLLGVKNADGSGEIRPLTPPMKDAQFTSSWSPDGKTIAYTTNYTEDRGGTRKQLTEDIWFTDVDGKRPPPAAPWFETPFREAAPAFSPDGKWIAYVSNESGNREVYVRPYPGPGAAVKVSTESGMEPAWTRGGRELLYRTGERGEKFMVVDVQLEPFRASVPRALFSSDVNLGGQWGNRGNREEAFREYDVSPDGNEIFGTRFLQADEPHRQLVIVTNWAATLPR